jgi:hypothetical protein
MHPARDLGLWSAILAVSERTSASSISVSPRPS